MFDYRALHRGCANPLEGKARPVAVFTFAQTGQVDRINFPNGSIFDAKPRAQYQPNIAGNRHQVHLRSESQARQLLNWVGRRMKALRL